MAEAEAEHPKEGHGEIEHEGNADPMHHILDKVLFGVDKTTGSVVAPYDKHGHLKQEYASYVPARVGPFKLEFTKAHGRIDRRAAVLFLAITMVVARRVIASIGENKAPRGPLANLVEALIVFVRDELVEPVGGHHLAHYTPLFVNYFFFLLICNGTAE